MHFIYKHSLSPSLSPSQVVGFFFFNKWLSWSVCQENGHAEQNACAEVELGEQRRREREVQRWKVCRPYLGLPWYHLWWSHLTVWTQLKRPPFSLNPSASDSIARPFCCRAKFLFLAGPWIHFSGAKLRVKEKQIDPPYGSCLALAVCETYDWIYRENTPKHEEKLSQYI